MSRPLLDRLSLRGLQIAPSQAYGGVRLVPLLRPQAPGDLRLGRRTYDEPLAVVALDGDPRAPKTAYVSYVPHGMVVTWSDDGAPAAAFGAALTEDREAPKKGLVRLAHRMAKREDPRTLRFLPLHLAMEGFLALHFGGPDVAWAEYSKRALSRGLSPRVEGSVSGRGIGGLEDALRLFEIHQDQVGVLIFVADALASAFIVSHPDDYRALHRGLLEDFYGELLYHYGLLGHTSRMEATLEVTGASTLDDLAGALDAMRAEWATFQGDMASGLFERPITAQRVHRCGPFQLQRFATSLDLSGEDHIGEAITNSDGTLEYLATYRLSGAQARRAHLLSRLAAHHWNLDATAAALRQSRPELIARLEKAGFGYLLADHVLLEARRRKRRT